MTTIAPRPTRHTIPTVPAQAGTVDDVGIPTGTETVISDARPVRTADGISTWARRSVDALRFALGFTFLWPFLDKLFGLGYSTAGAKSWLSGGSPTNGFLGHVEVGPFQSAFRGMAGAGVVDTLFMLGLLGVGVALLLGVALRVTAVAGSLILVLMWAAEWPLARFTSGGAATGSSNPFLDEHLIFAIGLFVVAGLGTASGWGLGRWWAGQRVVKAHRFLK